MAGDQTSCTVRPVVTLCPDTPTVPPPQSGRSQGVPGDDVQPLPQSLLRPTQRHRRLPGLQGWFRTYGVPVHPGAGEGRQ